MNAQDQLAKMAAKAFQAGEFSPDFEKVVTQRLKEYRAVLKWFAAEVERRAERIKLGWSVNRFDYAEDVKARAFKLAVIDLLRELSIHPQCPRCGSEAVPGHACKGEAK